MKEIKIFFVDFWSDFKNDDNFIVSALKERYKIRIDLEKPDYLFYSSFGFRHFQYPDAVKIYFTGENDVPDFNLCDYGIGSARLDFADRYFRLPLYVLYKGYDELFIHVEPRLSTSLQRKFCNFVYSNKQKADPIQEEFFHRLSQYKKVDSGGKYLNNIGQPVADKIDFIKDYKFTIAFENSSLPGYTTEKLIDPMRVNSIPIYWGNPDVGEDFNTKSFVNVQDYQSMDEAIEAIIFLDNNDEAYREKLAQPWIVNPETKDWQANLALFLKNIMEQPLPEVKRTTPYGFVHRYQEKQLISNIIYKNKLVRYFLKKIILLLYSKNKST
ncbi:hypothetical protein FACS189421_10590 [Bacteroidia bacterium]|nr:hypothetical protein FACS189421_10590 [Bacteroidia bacterium]GHT04648.1 hypothetical protein FACS189423_07640 [Bacteroidia bacterium]